MARGAECEQGVLHRDANDAWVSETWADTGRRARVFAAALIDLGLQHGERVAIMSGTRYEWLWCDYGAICAGGVRTSVYPSSLPADVEHILSDASARVVVAESAAQIDALRDLRSALPELTVVISLDGSREGDWLVPLEGVVSRGESVLAAQPYEALTGDDIAAILYTSGTTGRAKGVLLTHRSWNATLESLIAVDLLHEDDVTLLWLPLAHAFGKALSLMAVRAGYLTYIDGNLDRIASNLDEVKPTFMCSVPRILEKIHARVKTGAEANPVKRRLLDWAASVAMTTQELEATGERVPRKLGVQTKVADALVLKKIRGAFGGRLRFLSSGSGALDPAIAKWFGGAGITVLEGCGLTEAGSTTSLNRIGEVEYGTVGKPLPGTEVAFDTDGEILVRSASVMKEYHGNPEATAETFADDGWLRTGDVGMLTDRGNIRITDRKKNVFKTANGKYVAPSVIEARFMAVCPYAAQFVVVGESRRFVVGLIALDPVAMKDWAQERGVTYSDFAELMRTDEVQALAQGYVDELNLDLNRWEQIKKFVLLDRELTIEAGDLTPSMKLRRKAVERSFEGDIAAQYVEESSHQ